MQVMKDQKMQDQRRFNSNMQLLRVNVVIVKTRVETSKHTFTR